MSGCVLVCVLMETLGMSFVVPSAQCDLELTTKQKGILSAIAFIGKRQANYLSTFRSVNYI